MYPKLSSLVCFQPRRKNRSYAGHNEDFCNEGWEQNKQSGWVAYMLSNSHKQNACGKAENHKHAIFHKHSINKK